MPRNERFSGDYQYRIQNMLQTLTPYIVSKFKEAPRETRNANYSLAYFVKVIDPHTGIFYVPAISVMLGTYSV